MRLIDALKLTNNSRLALVGAGGKTNAMFRLAEQWLAGQGSTILLTTSTHLAQAEVAAADHHLIVDQEGDLESLLAEIPKGIVVLSGPILENSKVGGISETNLIELHRIAGIHQIPIIIEADGSARRPLKAPAAHEPVIPEFVDAVVVVVGLSAVGKQLDQDLVHRPERFSTLTGLPDGSEITADSIARMLLSSEGGLKGIPVHAQKFVLFNQFEQSVHAGAARSISNQLLKKYELVITASLKHKGSQEVISKHVPVAGIVLAAGGSQRLGQPKQLLDWQGQPFVRVAAQTAITAGLSPVFVIVGAAAAEVEIALDGLDVIIVMNEDWEDGQGSSLKLGIENLPARIQAVVVSLVDQPQIPPPMIGALVAEHAAGIHAIVAPMVDNRRGNPVLFDRETFHDLALLSGDIGGRKVFSKFHLHLLPWVDPRMGLDVDSIEDYQRLIEAWKAP